MIAGLILAAGESSRMGRDKALLPYRGKTFLESITDALRGAGVERIIVVLGHHADEIRRATNLSAIEVVVNQDYHRGQTSSLQTGLLAIGGQAVRGVLLCLVDHPAVRSETIRALIDAFHQSRAPVVIPTYQGRRGHPIMIGREILGEITALDVRQGANSTIRKYREQTHWVEVDDPGIVTDVDEPETFEGLKQDH